MKQLTIFDTVLYETQPTVANQTRNFVLIDGNNLLNRAYYATFANKPQVAPDGRPTNAVTLFMRMLMNFEKEYHAQTYVFFDEGKGFRKDLYPPYKEGRSDTPEELQVQFPIIRDVLTAAGIPFYMNSIYEADDLIACAVKHNAGAKFIISNDKDLYQLINEDTTVVVKKGKFEHEVTPTVFAEWYEGLEPKQITDLKALEGDDSDNIVGIHGIGKKGAMNIVQEIGDLNTLPAYTDWSKLKRYQKYFDEEGIKQCLFFKQLTTLRTDKEIKLKPYELNHVALRDICQTLNMKSIIAMI